MRTHLSEQSDQCTFCSASQTEVAQITGSAKWDITTPHLHLKCSRREAIK